MKRLSLELMKNEIVLFTDGDINIEVQINPEQETVWLTQKQMKDIIEYRTMEYYRRRYVEN